MKIETRTETIVSSVSLTKKEIEILVSAQRMLNRLWDELDEIDALCSSAQGIYNSLDEIGQNLDKIANLVDIED